MSDRIHQLIGDIRERANSFKDQLVDVREKNAQLEGKMAGYQADLEQKSAEIERLKAELEVAKTTEVDTVVSLDEKRISDEQIDELVREIDFCIAQLKR